MIFIANVLVMNGGTTFLLRMTRTLKARGVRCAVILLRDLADPTLLVELQRNADVIRLSRFQRDKGLFARGLLGVFAPIDWDALRSAMRPYGVRLHAMSVFGLVLGARYAAIDPEVRVTVGIYHQNEFIYRASRFDFPRRMHALFAAVPPENVIFFNESSRANYSTFFDRDYSTASLLPIGIALDDPPIPLPPKPLGRIVSVGNLVAFKTYNRHLVEAVAALRHQVPEIRYDIYGTGPTFDELQALIDRLGVSDRVFLHGTLDYARFRAVVADADLFVGSGTALVEAAAIGRPAMIGVESLEAPLTYGFLCDAEGFSYNERRADAQLHPIADLVREVLSDPVHWREIADMCEAKARAFSIDITAQGFETAFEHARAFDFPMSPATRLRLVGSAVAMRAAERLRMVESFGDRRNQSY